MNRLFRSGHGYLSSTIRCHLQNPKFPTPISHPQSFSTSKDPNPKLDFIYNEVEVLSSSKSTNQTAQLSAKGGQFHCQREPTRGNETMVQISHPWSEWVDLMELLLKRGYFEGNENPFRSRELGAKEINCIRSACLSFSRDLPELIRFLSRKDMQIIVGYGCPTLDSKVVNSGKRLRAHVGIDEGNVCSSCNLRGDCEKAYVKTHAEEVGRTVDVMFILLTYGLDSICGLLESKPCENAQKKTVKASTRRLLKEIVEYSSRKLDSLPSKEIPSKKAEPVQQHSSIQQEKCHIRVPMKRGDWICPKCNFLNFAKNIKCLCCNGWLEERLMKLKEDQDCLPLKKGDWICQRCNFLNFAKNTRCLQCQEKPPKRHLNPGDWECDSCNYINFRRNMVCLKCDGQRPKKLNKSIQDENYSGGDPVHGRSFFLHGDSKSKDSQSVEASVSAAKWRFVDEEREEYDSLTWDEDSRSVDFPIVGGKSSLSKNGEKWRLDRTQRNKSSARTNDNYEESRYNNAHISFAYNESTDDEVAEWFGQDRKLETRTFVSDSDRNFD